MTQGHSCTKCGEHKPLQEFHRYRSGSEQRRKRCKACEAIAAQERRENPPAARLVVDHYLNPEAPLSAKAEALIYTTAPVDPALIALAEKRRKLAEAAQRRRERDPRARPRTLAAWIEKQSANS